MDIFKLNTVRYVAGINGSKRYIEPRFEPEIPEHRMKYDNAKKLALDIGNPCKGSRHYVLIDGRFIFGDFIEALIVENYWDVEEMTISTLSASQENIDSLAGLMNGGYVKTLNMIVSDYFFCHERSVLVPYIYKALDKDNRFQLAVASVHTKICMIRTAGGNKIVIHGSANLRTSSNIEQIMIENNDGLYDFNYDFHASIISRYATINKSLRGNELWQVVQENSPGQMQPGQQTIQRSQLPMPQSALPQGTALQAHSGEARECETRTLSHSESEVV